MNKLIVGLSVLSIAACATSDNPRPLRQADTSAIVAAIENLDRPASHRNRDALRKPAELLTFAGIRPGDRVAEFLPVGAAGAGYFTRLFSAAVGPNGRIYGHVPIEHLARSSRDVAAATTLENDAGLTNLVILRQPAMALSLPEPVDIYWTSLNYHDVPLELVTSADLPAFNRAVYNALKPGGIYVIVDHAAAAGSGLRDLKLHRIDAEAVKQQVTSAGFLFEGELEVLRNPADNHSLNVFDPSIRGKTDQFVLKFRKPDRS